VPGGRDAGAGEHPLIERETALARLDAALMSACAGRGTVACIEGPPGVGKSRLLAAFGTETAALDVNARGLETERDLPFAVVRQLYEAVLGRLGAPERRAALAGPAQSAAWVLGGAPPPAAVLDQPAAVLHGIYWLTVHLAATRSLVLRVDDLQWADPASLRALAYLAARVSAHPVLLACAMRPTGPDDPPELLAPLATPDAVIVRLAPLGPAGSARLVRAVLGTGASARFCAACHRSTAGNPQLLHELLADVRAAGDRPDDDTADRIATIVPEAVARLVVRRLARLSPAARALARALAILGRAEMRHAAALAGIGEDAARDAVRQLAARSIVGDGLPLEFAHPILREAVRAELPAGARDVEERRAARLLAAEPAQRERAAAHLLACEPRGEPWAVAVLREAGAAALARGAPDAAAHAFERALAERPADRDPDLLAQLGAAYVGSGDPAATAVLEEAIARSGDAASRAGLVNQLAQAEFVAGRTDTALQRLAGALADSDLGPDAARMLEVGYLLLARQDPAFVEDARRRLAGHDERRAEGDPAFAAHLALDAYYAGDPAPAVTRLAVLGMRDPLAPQAGPTAAPFMMSTFALAGADGFDEAETAIDAVLARAREIGSQVLEGLAVHARLWVRWRRGALAGAEADARTVLAGAHRGLEYASLPARWALSEILLDRDRPQEARELLMPHVDRVLREHGGTQSALWILAGSARLRLVAGDHRGALRDALAVGDMSAPLQIRNPAHTAWRSMAARAAAALGEHGRAVELATEELELARAFGAPRTVGIALVGRGLAEARPEAALPWLEEATATLAGSPAVVERARALLALGAVLRRAQRRREARTSLREALELAVRSDAEALAERARSELAASGARLRRERLTGVEALTPREHEIAALAAAGHTNREIADRLYLTRGTVESHLRSVFRKLGVGSRRKLPEALGEDA
jgi:DNA-binding CsgD family transcriptional regulator